MALPPSQAPAKDEYAGDDINALILDPGAYAVRAGFAGEDTPKSVVPTSYAYLPSSSTKLYGENAIHLPRPDVEIRSPYGADGLVEDWDTASKLWEYSITSRLTGTKPTPPSRNGLNDVKKDAEGDDPMEAEMEDAEDSEKVLGEFPLLMSEPAWNPTKAREKTIEIAMEEWGVPAFFLAKNGQLAAYANGKATALVIDVGHLNTSITALWDGMVLSKSLVHTPLAGAFMTSQVRLMLAQQNPPVPITPHYMVKSKTPVDANTPAVATYTHFETPPHESFRALEEDRILTSFKESMVTVYPGPGRLDANVDALRGLPPRPFEMPDGYNTTFGIDRFKCAEGLFDHRAAYTGPSNPAPQSDQTLVSSVHKALSACDIDTRSALLGNVILTGGGSLLDKLPDRLQADLQAMYPNPRVRVIAASGRAERMFASWMGGSVLGSLGSWHQMWVSRGEYEEVGAGVVGRRCK